MAACISNSTRRNAPTTRKAGSGAAQKLLRRAGTIRLRPMRAACRQSAATVLRNSLLSLWASIPSEFDSESNRRVHLTSLGVTLMAIKCFSESVSTHPNASTISETSNSCACVSHRRTVTVSTPVLWVGLRLTRVEVKLQRDGKSKNTASSGWPWSSTVLGVLAWLAATRMSSNQTYYKTITELGQMGDQAAGARIRVGGDVASGSYPAGSRQRSASSSSSRTKPS